MFDLDALFYFLNELGGRLFAFVGFGVGFEYEPQGENRISDEENPIRGQRPLGGNGQSRCARLV